jgi:dynein heavy chain
MRNRID